MKSDDSSKSDEPIVIDLDAVKAESEGSSLTLAEYRDLSAKDRSSLTESQQKQLAEAQQQLRKAAESVYKSPAFKSVQDIDLSPLLRIASEQQKTLLSLQPTINKAFGIQDAIAPAIKAIYKSSLFAENQFTALATMQKLSLNYPMDNLVATIKNIQDIFLAPFIARTMFADFHTAHERILRNLRFEIGSLTASIEFSSLETVGIDLADVTSDDGNLTATAVATQTSSAGSIAFTDNASLVLAFNDLKNEVHDLKKQLLSKDNSQGNLLLAPSAVHFHRTSSSIQIGSYKVSVAISSKQTQFARILTSEPTKRWDIEDIVFLAFGERIDKDEADWIIKIRSYIHQLNNKILRDTNNTMRNFFMLDGIEVYVNPDYLNL